MSFGLWWSRFCRPPRASVAVGGVITARSLRRSRGGSGRAVRGGTCPTILGGRGGRRGSVTAAGPSTAPTLRSSPPSGVHMASTPPIWTLVCRNCCPSTPPACVHISTPRALDPTPSQGATSNDKDLPVEPADHALGRSRGGLTTKIHALTDQATCPVTVLLTAGQAGDNPQLIPLLDAHQAARSADGTGKTPSGCSRTKPTPIPQPGTSSATGGSRTPSRNEPPNIICKRIFRYPVNDYRFP